MARMCPPQIPSREFDGFESGVICRMVRRGSFAFGHYKGERVFRSRHPPCSTPDGGRRRGRTWNPMIKSRQQAVLVQRSFRHVHVSSGIEIAIEFSFVGIEGCREGAIGSHRTFGGSSRESATPHYPLQRKRCFPIDGEQPNPLRGHYIWCPGQSIRRSITGSNPGGRNTRFLRLVERAIPKLAA
jgi:hypothetical protein